MVFTSPESKPPMGKRTKIVIALFATMGVLVLASAITLGVLWKATGSKTYYAASDSMAPEIREDDTFMTVPIDDGDTIERAWVVMVVNPDTGSAPEAEEIVKRVVAVPGDTIEARDGRLYVNEQPADEPYLAPGTITENVELQTLPPGEYYVLGDNRQNSLDSRAFGTVSDDELTRRVTRVLTGSNPHELKR
jgi:signal peptidase I